MSYLPLLNVSVTEVIADFRGRVRYPNLVPGSRDIYSLERMRFTNPNS